MNLLKNLAGGGKKREASGPLTGRTLSLQPYTVRVEALVGEGGFATIYRAVDPASHEVYAVKHFRLSGDPEAERDVQVNWRRQLRRRRCLAHRRFALLLDFANALASICT